MGWHPLSERGNPESESGYDALHEGVPEWLQVSHRERDDSEYRWYNDYRLPDHLVVRRGFNEVKRPTSRSARGLDAGHAS